jgi:hypothetical protein
VPRRRGGRTGTHAPARDPPHQLVRGGGRGRGAARAGAAAGPPTTREFCPGANSLLAGNGKALAFWGQDQGLDTPVVPRWQCIPWEHEVRPVHGYTVSPAKPKPVSPTFVWTGVKSL